MEFRAQIPLEQQRVVQKCKSAKTEFQTATAGAHASAMGSLRGLLGGAFPIIRNRYQIGKEIYIPTLFLIKN
jgi:hypothetical protein